MEDTIVVSTQKHSVQTPKLLANRVAIVTGSSHGIGASIAKLFAQHGAAVGINYHSSEDAAQQIVEEIVSDGGKAIAVQADVCQIQEVESMVQQVTETFGVVDTLILNANVLFEITPFIEQAWSDFEAKLLGEIKSAFYPCKAIVPSMIEHQRGCIVAISSMTSRHADPGFSAHTTAKSGLDGFVKSLAKELGPEGIRVNAVAPGVTLTNALDSQSQEWKDSMAEQTPLRRNAQPEDIAGSVLMLASEYTSFVNGAYLMVNGGINML
jgi:3-oxoacyl-[acyl-carrier protein] reductase